MKNTIVKDTLILFAITLVAGLGLGVVHEITAEPIEQANYETQQAAYQEVFPDASEFIDLPDFDTEAATAVVAAEGYSDSIDACVQAVDDIGELLGYVITVTDPDSYGGSITFSIGVTLDGILNGYSITDISDTPGLGMKAKEEDFSSQFVDKEVQTFTVTKTGSTDDSQIDAITGATITSTAMTNGVNAGLVYYSYVLEETGGELLNE